MSIGSVVSRYRVAWESEFLALQRTLQECSALHTTPPPNYWVPEYRARKKFEMAIAVAEICQDATDEVLRRNH